VSAVRASFYPCLYAEDLTFIFQNTARENFGFQKGSVWRRERKGGREEERKRLNSGITKKKDEPRGDRKKEQYAQSPLTLAHGAPHRSSTRPVLYSANSTIRQLLAKPRTVRLRTWPVGEIHRLRLLWIGAWSSDNRGALEASNIGTGFRAKFRCIVLRVEGFGVLEIFGFDTTGAEGSPSRWMLI
jgi:hypothetical protein